ncbi:MAG: tRNA (adenosine(37)-N6)-threonylcarbamoyltransferase complex dimerization subunit type 1 TsaB [Pseudomonadota bacterium]
MAAPRVLGLDSSGPHIAVAAISAGQVSSRAESMARGQAERLIGFVEALLRDLGLGYRDIDAIAVGTGPGNFTGIRISVATAKGLGLALGLPVYGFDGFAQRLHLRPQDPPTIPAPRGQCYVLREGRPTMIEAGACLWSPDPKQLAHALAELGAAAWPAPPVARVSPTYVKPPDAAPPRDAAPAIRP